ncbi:MAG: TonB-dependent receptor plug domain-containing protein [Gemmatimonadetes bacterium]|nr:TonB-dependent receptor plug domain-containing protein [Gemmatimonadota bacterium]
MKARYAVAVLFVLALVVGVSAAEAQGRRNRNVITAEEIAKSSAGDAYDLIRGLRPAWFVTRGVVSADPDAGGIVIYVDGIRQGYLSDLRSIPVERIQECRFLDARDATTRYGTGHPSGVIEITTRR